VNVQYFWELLICLVLLIGVLYFMFDVKDITWKLAGWAAGIGVLIGWGFFMGIGMHLCNMAFGW